MCHLFLFYLFLLYLIFLELNDLLLAFWRGSHITAGTKTRHPHHAQGGFSIYTCQEVIHGIFSITLVITFLYLAVAPLCFNLPIQTQKKVE